MKIYVLLNGGARFDTMEDAAAEAQRLGLKEAELDVYDADTGAWLEGEAIDAESGYSYTAYCIWDYTGDDRGTWYQGIEVMYNAEAEARDVLKGAPRGRYSIDRVSQTVSEYGETVDRTEIIIE